MANLVHPKKYEILDGQLCPEPLYWTRRGRGRPTIKDVTTSSSAPAEALEGEKPTPGQHEEISLVTFPSMATVLPTDELTLVNRAELERWDAYNKQLYSVLFLFTKGAAKDFLVCFARRPDSRERLDGQPAWKTIGEKYPSSLIQRCGVF